MTNQQQPTQQPAQQQAAQPQQEQQIQKSQNSEYNPIAGVQLPSDLIPTAQWLAAPYEQFAAAYDTVAEGRKVWNRELNFVVGALTANTPAGNALRNAFKQKPLDLINAVKTIGISGLSLNPALKQGYLYLFGGTITFVPSYVGLSDVLTRTGLVTKLQANLVYKDDFFEVEYGANEHLVHKPNPFSVNRTKNNILGGYWYADLPNGTHKFGTMTYADIEKVRSVSPAGKSGPWVQWWEEMAKKTLIRKAFKELPHVGVSDNNLKILEATMREDDKLFIDTSKMGAPKNTEGFYEVEEVTDQVPVGSAAQTEA